ncbi:hypothetical protein [Thalassotalea aquiviva]|uniref:hypothetical protein n=1 Tax=Thalassotalea aquiviva TaxID=3242415 RepID=UPI00352AD87F
MVKYVLTAKNLLRSLDDKMRLSQTLVPVLSQMDLRLLFFVDIVHSTKCLYYFSILSYYANGEQNKV